MWSPLRDPHLWGRFISVLLSSIVHVVLMLERYLSNLQSFHLMGLCVILKTVFRGSVSSACWTDVFPGGAGEKHVSHFRINMSKNDWTHVIGILLNVLFAL